ncbi:MAG: DUF1631 family protein, partial [Bradyrhizobium sp.]
EAIQVIDADAEASGTLKKSVRRLLVDQRDFSSTFFSAVEREIDAAVDSLFSGDAADKKDKPAGEKSALSLSLVDYDQMEEDMMVDRFAARVRNAADAQYGPLTQRLATALGIPGLGERDNPFHPIRFCKALGEAVDKLGFKGDQRMAVIRAYDSALGGPLTELYTGLNKQLEGQGIKEQDSAAAFKNTVLGFRNTFVGAGRPTQQPLGSVASHSGATAEQLLNALYQRMQMPLVPMMQSTVVPTQPLFDRADLAVPMPGTPVAPGTGFPNTGVFAQPGGGGAAGMAVAPGTPVQFAAIDPGLLASINDVQRLNALAAVASRSGSGASAISERDEAQLRAHVSEKATKQIDKLVIELVGMLFDRIHQDKHLPAEIKTALSRLQFPIMKVALSDSDLFVSPLQPARRLMDRIASTA